MNPDLTPDIFTYRTPGYTDSKLSSCILVGQHHSIN